MAKKTFNNPTKVSQRKGLDILINEPQTGEEYHKEDKYSYTTSNVRVRNDFREKIYTLKGRTGKSITDIYNMIFDEYFKKNPL